MTPALSVIVVTYNHARWIGDCLAALLRLRPDPVTEILVVDNGSEDETRSVVAQGGEAVRLLVQDENLGFAGAVNRGVLAAQGQTIALLNPDALPRPDWGYHLVVAAHAPDVGVAAGKVLDVAGHLQSVGCVLDTAAVLPAYRGAGEVDHGQYDRPADVWSAHGASMAFRREVWEAVNGFDAGYFPAYLEESDFCQRVRQAGYRVVTAPQAVVSHAEASTTGKGSAEFYYYFHRNRLRYAARWMTWSQLWQVFRPAETLRLRTAPLLDRRVAQLAYRAGVPSMALPTAAERTAILATGRALRSGSLPDDGLDSIIRLLEEAREKNVLTPVSFQSRLPGVAALRSGWNAIATRWYVRPSLDQQSQWNLAVERSITQMIEQAAAQRAADALALALLGWQIEAEGRSPDERSLL